MRGFVIFQLGSPGMNDEPLLQELTLTAVAPFRHPAVSPLSAGR
jgi:hypothetical protein